MHRKGSAYLWKDEDFEVGLEAFKELRQLFLTMPYEEFVNVKALREALPENGKLRTYLMRLDARLDFGMDSFRYFMRTLSDAKTAEVAKKYEWHNVHTDFRGRSEISRADKALGFAMGFKRLDEELNVESLGYDPDPGAVEETVSTELGDVLLSGYRNSKGNYHGYCQIEQKDGVLQSCFFNNGVILAREIFYPGGTGEDCSDLTGIAIDPFANRTVYVAFDDGKGGVRYGKVPVERDVAEKAFNVLNEYYLEMAFTHEVTYPYEDGSHDETENARCIPCLDMALFKDGELWGVVTKTNGYKLLPLDSVNYSLQSNFRNYALALGEELSVGNLYLSLKKREK